MYITLWENIQISAKTWNVEKHIFNGLVIIKDCTKIDTFFKIQNSHFFNKYFIVHVVSVCV